MADINSIPNLRTLYRILHRDLRNTRLEHAENIHYVPLYKDNREDSLEESFDPIGQDAVNSAMGYWCYTCLFYDERGTAIRRVPVGRGGWNQRNAAKLNITRDGQTWCMRKLMYDNVKMLQYSLGRVDDQPEYAICHLFRLGAQIVDDVAPDNSTHQGGTVGEPNEIGLGSSSGTNNNTIGEPEAPLPSVIVPPSQNYNEYVNLSKRRRYEIEDPSERTKWPIESDNIAEMLIMAVKFLLRQCTLQIHDPSDKSEWTIENGKITEVLKMFMSALDQSMHEIPQTNVAPPYMHIEDVPSTSRVQQSQHGAADTSNESALHQDQNLRHQSCMPTLEGSHTNNQDDQQSDICGTFLHLVQGQLPNNIIELYGESLNMGIEDNQPTMQFQTPQHEAAEIVNDSAMLQDQNLSHQPYGMAGDINFECHWQQNVELLSMGIEVNQATNTMQVQAHQHGAVGIVNDSAMLQDQNLSHQPYGMTNQSNAHINDPFDTLSESSAYYNQGFSNDDINNSDPDNFDG